MSRQQSVQVIFEHIGIISRQIQSRVSKPFLQYNLSRPYMDILFLLSAKEQVNIKSIADYLKVTSGAASQFIDNLESKKLVKRVEDPADRRGCSIRLTKASQLEISSFKKMYYSASGISFENLDDKELQALEQLIQKVRIL